MAAINVPSSYLPFSFCSNTDPTPSPHPQTPFSHKQTFPSSTSYRRPPAFLVRQSNYSHWISDPAPTSDTVRPPPETSEPEEPEKLQTPPAYTPSVWGNYFLSYTPVDSEAEQEKPQTPPAYTPSVWGNYFLSYTPFDNEDILMKEHQSLKEKVEKELLATTDQPLEHLKMIDAIERLGVAHHFNDQIEESLARIYRDYVEFGYHDQYDLYYVSLRFRLLRQHGYYIASDSFERFTDRRGDFLESLASDTMGILSLYEASHLRVYAEDILENALSFTTSHLRRTMIHSDSPFFEEVKHALSRPLQKSVGRLEARHHVISYSNDLSNCDALVKFAKVDFNMFQSFYKQELQELTRWWEELRYAEKFPLARDRLMEHYLLLVGFFGTLCEPKYSSGRVMVTKMIFILTVIDDLHDLYGTHEEAKALAEAVERWDRSYTKELPDSIKLYYETLLDVFEGVENDLVKEGKANYVPYALEEVKAYTRASYKGFRSHRRTNLVTYEEYLRHSAIAIGLRCTVALMMATMEEAAQEDFEWLSMYPNVIRASSTICRLLNDIEGYETDKKEGRVSTVSCYMKQYGVSREEACAELYRRIEEEWIEINEEICMHPSTGMRKCLVIFGLSMAQTSHMFYDGEDGFRMVSDNVKDNIARIFVEPIAL